MPRATTPAAPVLSGGIRGAALDRWIHWLTPDRLTVYPVAIAVSVAVLWVASLLLGPGLTNTSRCIVGGDFAAFYTGARFLLDGQLDELYDFGAQKAFQDGLMAPVRTEDVHPFINPPFALVMFLPFAVSGYVPGLLMWWAAGLGVLAATLRLLRDELFGVEGPPLRRLMLLAVLFYPTLGWLMYGQSTSITLGLFALAFVMLRRGRDFAGGLALGLLFYKPQLILAAGVMLLVSRRWRAMAGTAVGVGAWTAVGLLLFPAAMVDYLRVGPTLFEFLRARGEVLGVHIDYPIWGSHSFYGFCILLLNGVSRSATDLLSSLLTLSGVGAVAFWWRRTAWRPGDREWDLTVAATLALGVLISPHLFFYDLMLLLLPLAIVYSWHRAGADGRPLNGGPLLGMTALLYVATFLSSYLANAQLQLADLAGLPEVAVQISVPVIVLWAWVVYRASRATPMPLPSSSTG